MIEFVCTEYDELGERFQLVRRIRLFHGYRLTFEEYVRRPDRYDQMAADRMKDWTLNPRWSPFAKTTIYMN